MTLTQVNDIQIYYEEQGQGDPVLFISGTGGDLRNKPNVFDGPLPGCFRVVSYDQRGLGQSQKPPQPYAANYTMAHYADDAAALLDALGWSPVPVVGVSFGGMVAQELALRHPRKVSALALVCTSSGGAGGASYPLHEMVDMTADARARKHLALADMRRDTDWQQANPERWQALVDLAVGAVRADRDEAGALGQLLARADHDTFARLPELDLPTLIMGGKYDGVAPLANQQALQQQIRGSALRLYEGGHLFLAQDKSAYPDLVQWLQSVTQ